jgi:hypothetical protein
VTFDGVGDMTQTDNNPAPEPSTVGPPPSAPALRMRRHRKRRRGGLRCLTVEVRDSEIDALVRKGLLSPETRNSTGAIKTALYTFLDRTLGSTP